MKAVFRLVCILAASLTLGGYSAHAEPLCDSPPPTIWQYLPNLPRGCQRERIQASGELSFNVFRKASKIAEEAWQLEVLTKYGERFQDINFAACKNVLCVKGAVSGTERCTISAYPCASDMDERHRAMVDKLTSLDTQNLPEEFRHGEAASQREELKEERREAREEIREEERRVERREAAREEERREERREERLDARELNPQEIVELQHLLNRAGYRVHTDGVFGDESRDALSAFERRAGLPDDGYPTYPMLERLRRDFR